MNEFVLPTSKQINKTIESTNEAWYVPAYCSNEENLGRSDTSALFLCFHSSHLLYNTGMMKHLFQ